MGFQRISSRLFSQRRPSVRARRSGLSLVALMDVFTILVFFFLVHSTDGMSDASDARVQLPDSIAERPSSIDLVVTVTPRQILVQGTPVMELGTMANAARTDFQPLQAALQQLLARNPGMAQDEVTIMGDRSIPFTLLHQVMQTCNRAGYAKLSLAVQQRSPESAS